MTKNLPLALTFSLMASAAFAEVNIYSTRQPELIDPILETFTKETGIEVNTVFIKDGLIERLKAEGKRSPADMVLTVDIANLAAIAHEELTAEIKNETLEAKIPVEFRDPQGKWFGLTSRARVIYASKERVGEGEVSTYEELADPKWKGRICTRSGTHDYSVALISADIAHHGLEEATKWLEGLKANLARKPQGNDRAQVKAIWAGECDISLGNTYYMGEMLKDDEQKAWAESVNLVFPKFEDGGTHINLSGMAMTKSAKNQDDALALMEFLVSDEAQKLYAELNYEYPIVEGIKSSDLVESWGMMTPDTLSMEAIAKERSTALRLVETVGFDN